MRTAAVACAALLALALCSGKKNSKPLPDRCRTLLSMGAGRAVQIA